METTEHNQASTEEMLCTHSEISMKHNKELSETSSSLVDRKEQINDLSYVDTNKQLSLYENKITSPNAELEQLKKENMLLQTQNKEVPSIKEDTQQLKTLMSTVKGEVHNIHNLMNGKIKGFKEEIHVEKIHTKDIYCIIELKDERIATCGDDHSISVVSLDYETKKWKQDIKKENAHDDYIYSLCELNNNRLVSCSHDKTIKIWKITENDLNLLSTLTDHSELVFKVIPLTNNRFSSCSQDKTVKIWNSESLYELITSLPHDDFVFDVLQLKQKEILISCTVYVSTRKQENKDLPDISIDFWNSENYKKLHSIKGYLAGGPTIIELPNGLVAVPTTALVGDSGYLTILIIDPITYSIIKKIKLEEYTISKESDLFSFCVLNKHSFICINAKGDVVQIAIDDEFNILYKSKEDKEYIGDIRSSKYGLYGPLSVKGGEYLISPGRCGLKVFKVYYS